MKEFNIFYRKYNDTLICVCPFFGGPSGINSYDKMEDVYKRQEPNAAHLALVELEAFYEVHIITQNVDDLHERAGSTNVLHLHGELNKARSSFNTDYIVPCLGDQLLEDKDNHGHPMRPHIVFFGENVPMFPKAEKTICGRIG